MMLGLWMFRLLPFPCQILYCQYWPTWYFADVSPYGRNVAQEEDGSEEEGEPDDVAIHLLDCHEHHGVQVAATHKFPEVEMREVEVGEGQLANIMHHVLIKEMREDGGIKCQATYLFEVKVSRVIVIVIVLHFFACLQNIFPF